MRTEAVDADHDVAVGEIAAAEKAAAAGDGAGALARLKRAGAWTLGIAEQIGVALVVEAIKVASRGGDPAAAS